MFRVLLASMAALYTVSSFGAIEEIVVTAQKRTESVQDVPISITALSGEDLLRRGLLDMQDVARAVPNFDMPASNNMRNVSVRIRGIGSTGTNPGIENSVGTFLDGLYMPAGAMSFGELTDIQTIEILRGPQGTLYGRNTPIGALNITTLRPSNEPEVMLRVGYADYDQASISGHLGGGLSVGPPVILVPGS
jgi:iron complex outermembrane receptor protein